MLIKRKIITIKSRQVKYIFRRTDRRGVAIIGSHPCKVCNMSSDFCSLLRQNTCSILYYKFNHSWVYVYAF